MKIAKKLWNGLTTVLVALVVVLAVLLVGVRLVGLTPYVVLSGSMEPTYHTGSLIYVKKADPFTIEAGTPITFMMDEDTIATHRVVAWEWTSRYISPPNRGKVRIRKIQAVL